MVGHDLRNPLGAISMAAQLMLRRDQLDVDDRRAAQRIVDSAGRMGRLIGKLMDYAQIRRGGELTMNFAPADIHAATRTAVDELTLARPDREIFVDTRGAGDGVWDADRITEVVSNLVGNALQHGDGPVHVVVHDAERGGGTA
jgi:signal transduction histidine kinase